MTIAPINGCKPTTATQAGGRSRGFTVVELVVTLVIIGALAAVSAPLFFNTQTFQQSGFFNETLSAVRYAQKLAVATGCTVRVNFSANGYGLFNDVPVCDNTVACTAANYGNSVAHPAGSGAFAGTAPEGVPLLPAASTDICFRPLGNASTDVTLSVGGRSLRVWAATGFVERL